MNTKTVEDLVQKQRDFFLSGQTRPIDFRLDALRKLRDALKVHEKDILAAVYADLRKAEVDAYATELAGVYNEIKVAIANVRDWAAREKVTTPIFMMPAKSYIYKEPYGVCLIIAPWNYPVQLAMLPLVGAIAAGNTAIVKPSELASHSAAIIDKVLGETFPEEYIRVVQGGVEETHALLAQQLDYIFFTGSVPVGKVVMEAAAKNLTPLTLELGGKSPAIVHESADLPTAASRIAWGKFMNAGQTCIAPDYVVVHEAVSDAFLNELVSAIRKFYGDDASTHPRYCRIINDRHFTRLEALIDPDKLAYGGKTNAAQKYIEPTLLYPVDWNHPAMADEIFGPILPIITYSRLDEVISRINKRPKPLALYLFAGNKDIRRKIIGEISFGGGAVNNTIMHIVSHYLPFGGVGQSGMGRYHGKYSFDTFSHTKSILRSYNLADPVDAATPDKGKLFNYLMKLMK
ncbi:MAG TPA: aldehyde dehydrogenase [Smithellaceae bacterium]|jgi:aldehyde dehydrogenase (NAD+)|nr:aldehyde dehydrogenase [Syntrophaceae bacterium]HPV50112.1 aldehyde dehydrogenase [Smithellaceae bacterium]